jgi:surfactin synthase thioesterase subunit
MNTVNLLCFPFAGGGKYSYNSMKAVAGRCLNLINIELPGRGSRMKEQLLVDIDAMVEDVMEQVKDNVREPYAIYGHSMGSLLGYLVATKIGVLGLRKPLSLFFSGGRSPALLAGRTSFHLLPKEEFFPTIAALGGITDETLKYPDILTLYEPIVRADFQAVETYVHRQLPPVDMDISIMIGEEDEVTRDEAMAWQKETTGMVSVTQFPGGHFFIFQHETEIVRIIQEKLANKIIL